MLISSQLFLSSEERNSPSPNVQHSSREPITDSNHPCESAGDDDFTYPIVDDVLDESPAPLSDEVELPSTSDSVSNQPEATCQVLPSSLMELYSEEY